MSERKRQRTTKLSKKNRILNTTRITKFEDLPNELILICFDYFDFYSLYDIFYSLNKHFNKLIENHAKIFINLTSIPNKNFLTFCFKLSQFLTTNQNNSLALQTYDEYRLNLILDDGLFKQKLSKLKSLTISNVDIDTISYTVFDEESEFYEILERLTLINVTCKEDHTREQICTDLISSKMKSLKYLNLNFEVYSCGCEQSLYINKDYVDLEFSNLPRKEKTLSNLETIVIGYIPENDDDTTTTTKISFNTLVYNLLPYLPKLKNLLINSIHFDEHNFRQRNQISSTERRNFILPSNLKTAFLMAGDAQGVPLQGGVSWKDGGQGILRQDDAQEKGGELSKSGEQNEVLIERESGGQIEGIRQHEVDIHFKDSKNENET